MTPESDTGASAVRDTGKRHAPDPCGPMIPRIQTGTSFKGAGLYYLHDKKLEGETERLTTERVAWTYAINTVENDPEAVLAEMRQTSFDQPILKMLSGNRIDGRPTETPVMTVALAWSPEQNPTQNQMIEAGHSYLQHMGWEAHQALFVAHNDTKHPHMHMIINRVHPETGMVLDDSWSKTRSQKWALGYERENGRIFCQAREAKYGRREMNDAPHLHRSEWKLWQEISKENAFDPEYHRALEAGEWETLKQGQKQERIDFWKQTGQMRKDLRGVLREEVREEFKEEWRTYNALKAERLEQGRAYDKEARRALKHYARLGGMHGSTVELKEGRFWKTGRLRKDRDAEIDPVSRAVQDARDLKSGYEWKTSRVRKGQEPQAVTQIKERRKEYHAKVRDELAKMRADISSRQKNRLKELAAPALDKFGQDRVEAYDALKARHRADRAELRNDHAAGERRQDVLGGLSANKNEGAALTPVQVAAYLAHARQIAAQHARFNQAGGEIARTADRAPDDPRRRDEDRASDPLEDKRARTEQTARHSEQSGRKQEENERARQRAWVDAIIETRRQDREREGGRER